MPIETSCLLGKDELTKRLRKRMMRPFPWPSVLVRKSWDHPTDHPRESTEQPFLINNWQEPSFYYSVWWLIIMRSHQTDMYLSAIWYVHSSTMSYRTNSSSLYIENLDSLTRYKVSTAITAGSRYHGMHGMVLQHNPNDEVLLCVLGRPIWPYCILQKVPTKKHTLCSRVFGYHSVGAPLWAAIIIISSNEL